MSREKNKPVNVVLIALIVILVVCFGIIGYEFYVNFYAGVGQTKYGDRLEGIEKYVLSETLEDDIKSLYTSNSNIDEVTVNVKGKLVYVTINFATATKAEEAKTLALKSLDKIGEDNLTYYDIQFLLTYSSDASNAVFPLFGARKSTSTKVVWGNK